MLGDGVWIGPGPEPAYDAVIAAWPHLRARARLGDAADAPSGVHLLAVDRERGVVRLGAELL